MRAITAATVAAAALLALWRLDPSATPIFPPCIFRAVTGWQCPGCGSARALHALLNGEIAAALRANPLAVAAVPLVGIETTRHALGARPSLSSFLGRRTILAIAMGLLLFAVLRNI